MRRPAAFFDRDGVLNRDTGFAHRIDELQLIDGAAAAVRRFNTAGWWVFVVSNQSGVARGYFDEAAVRGFNAALQQALATEDARIDAIYYCPHHPQGTIAAYARVCDCRKPKPGMLTRALAEWPVEVTRSLMIGDRPTDIEAATAAGLRGFLFGGGNLAEFCVRLGLP
jgi:histidinol-phosphate phosphatase family domain/HAD-superfamily hydrolase, subfamily IIIA